MRKAVFEIASAITKNSQIHLAGRAYEIIRVSDRVLMCNSLDLDGDCVALTVAGISMYGRELQEMDAGYSGLLTLEESIADWSILPSYPYIDLPTE
jgi:hypothetical protein